MKCDGCGRGFTFRRIARDAAFIVTSPHGSGQFQLCGQCMDRGVLDVVPDDVVTILLVDALAFKFYPAEPTESIRHRRVVRSSMEGQRWLT